MKKILHLISGGDTGGAKTHIFSLMKGLEGLVETKIICFIKDTFYVEAKERGIDIEVYPQKSRSDMSVIKKLSDEIKKEKYDLVHAHGARANFITLFLKKHIDIPMVTTIHSDYKLDFKDSFYKNLIYTTLNKIALKKFDYYICVSDNFKDMLISRGFRRDRIHVLYNGIDTSIVDVEYSKTEFLKKYNIDYDNEFIVGIAARLDKVKDHETFIRAIKKTAEKNKDIIYLIAGEGDELNHLKSLIEEYKLEKIYFLGFVRENKSFFNAIDLNVLTSISESFPYVILESALLKTPTASTDTGGINKIIRDRETGFLFSVKDYEKLSEDIIYGYENRDEIKIYGEEVYKNVVNNYSTKAMGMAQYEIYKNILDGGK